MLRKSGQRIRELREKSGIYGQAELGMKVLGIATKQAAKKRISKIETGATVIRPDEIVKLASFFIVSTDYLLCQEESNDNVESFSQDQVFRRSK